MGMVTAIVAAAGSGRRMGGGGNKVFLPLAGVPILARSIAAVAACPEVEEIIVVVAPGEEAEAETLLGGAAPDKRRQVVTGGSERQYSVARALDRLSPDARIVVVHDGARPLVRPEVISAAIAAAGEYGAAGVATPVKDTIKMVDGDGFAYATPERSTLWAIQTPQAFQAELLKRAYARAAEDGVLATDDAALVERLGVPVKMVRGDYANLKITTPEDMLIAGALGGKGADNMLRIGMGYDVHRLVDGRRLILGGVDIPFAQGLLGHSDADVLLHAIKDALLGAAGLGDIGRHFPDSDARFAGASSLKLLETVGEMLAAAGWRTGNVDAVVMAEKPKLAAHIPQMNENIAAALSIGVGQVNVKATTTEGLGFAGRREGIAAQAVVTIMRAC